MPKARPTSKTTTLPWYLSAGDQECPHCGLLYAYELEFRCPDCDGPGCPHCRVKHTEYFVCIGCVPATDEDADHGR
jgi:hypothetical protein